jgi:hypothetical protein
VIKVVYHIVIVSLGIYLNVSWWLCPGLPRESD